jgi:glyoxylase-like metal-dependent hydrolase (beta-lactamase superfamily II)/8-oxo-dGTP pyrophosphatase MutT (NUDIX family)
MTAFYQPAADARAAASLLLLRDGAGGLEVLMLRRAERDGDMRSGAVVFPGGVLDAGDRDAHRWCLGPGDAEASARLGVAEGGLDYLVAAVREAFEEVGLLIAARPDGSAFDAAAMADALQPWRLRLNAGEASIGDFCNTFDLRLDLRSLAYTSHWLTPPGMPKRFDTRFFSVPAPGSQTAVADGSEALELMWLTPRAALDPARGYKLLPVTQRTLQQLGAFADARGVWTHAQAQRDIPLVMPRRAATRRGLRIVLPDEHAYAEVARLDPEGRGDASAEIVAGAAVRLSPRIVRVTAPNPGVMTGPGTNSYLVGAGDDWTVIDPGPADEAHRQALLAAAPGPIRRILVTHTHADHSPGAIELARATGAALLGQRARHAQGQDLGFVPDRELEHGERLGFADGSALRVIHTPGHASNHLCYLLEAEKTLFTGDHVMQGSTVVINPPDGDMALYLQALQALLDEDLDWLAPGHGFLVAQPHALLRALIEHRLKREARVLAALRAAQRGPLDALLPQVYADVPAALHPVARRSLLAHLLKLQADGLADADGEAWMAVDGGA